MAVLGFLFRAQLRECLLDLRKIKQRIIAETICSARTVKNDSFGCPAKSRQRLAVPGGGQHADESSSSLSVCNALQLMQNARIVGVVIGVCVGFMRFLILQNRCRVAGRVHAGSAAQSVNLQARIVGDHDLARNAATVGLRFLPRISLEGKAILNHRGQGSEVRNAGNLHSVTQSGAGEVAQLAGIGRCDEDFSRHAFIS